MDERKATALLKQRFEAAGFTIAENVALDEDGISFEVDGFDADKRVGYEYVSRESGDGWDVGEDVIAALDEHRAAGTLNILVVDENDAPDEPSLGRAADTFLKGLTAPKAKAKAEPKGDAKPKAKADTKPAKSKKPAKAKKK
jgi:hypothetical protein